MNIDIKTVFVQLGSKINEIVQNSNHDLIYQAYIHNKWFEPSQVQNALKAWVNALDEEKINLWLSKYDIGADSDKKIGVIMAGNIPLVGLHDALCVLASGAHLYAKLSSDDKVLMSFVLNQLSEIEPKLKDKIHIVENLKNIDALIATGSDNSARYFEYYFRDKPKILRKNRTSIAILIGNESKEELFNLGKDIFSYFGLGCRNVSKLLIPDGYDLNVLFEAFFAFKAVSTNHKYMNNYDYHRALYLLNKEPFLDNNFVILKEDKSLHSPVGVLFYQYYQHHDEALDYILENKEKIQCVVSAESESKDYVSFGNSQQPQLWDYADGVDVMEFLLGVV